MMRFIFAVFLLTTACTSVQAKNETALIKQMFEVVSPYVPIVKNVYKFGTIAINLIERFFNVSILPSSEEDTTSEDYMKEYFHDLSNQMAELKTITIDINENNKAEKMFSEIEECIRNVGQDFQSTLEKYAFLMMKKSKNMTAELPETYKKHYDSMEEDSKKHFDCVKKTIIGDSIAFEGVLQKFETSLKTLEDVCKTRKSKAMVLTHLLEQLTISASQVYATLDMSSNMKNQSLSEMERQQGSVKNSFHLAWSKIERDYKEVARKLKTLISKSSRAFWSCGNPKSDEHEKIKKQQYYYVSLQESVSDFINDSVVTGARFELVDDTFYLTIQEAQLLPNGTMDTRTRRWKPVVTDPRNRVRISKHQTNEIKAFDLTEVHVPKGHVITGLQLHPIAAETDNYRLGLLVYSTKYNFYKGVLVGQSNGALQPHVPEAARNKLLFKNKNEGLKHSEDDSYVLIDESKEDGDNDRYEDQGIPLLDTQDVSPLTLTPMSGVGLFTNLNANSGNFIGIKLYTYDSSSYISTDK